ncbi:glycosyltransferase [Flagellimonas marinaquae]
MILIDALHINSGGGKVLLDYLVQELEKADLDVFYLFDARCSNDFKFIPAERKTYLKASLLNRHHFYKKNKNKFSKVFCFGNIPPTIKLKKCKVYTYFHQKLYIEAPADVKIKQRLSLKIRKTIISYLSKNTIKWVVQTELIKKDFLNSFHEISYNDVLVIPFYPSLNKSYEKNIVKEKNTLIYVSQGLKHKNHHILLNGFIKYYDEFKTGKLILTVHVSHRDLFNRIKDLQNKGYPIENLGHIDRKELYKEYYRSEFTIYPSLSESLGLGIIEAIESGTNIIGSDLPYLKAVCIPSLTFDPLNSESVYQAIKLSKASVKPTKQLIFNQINDIIKLLSAN